MLLVQALAQAEVSINPSVVTGIVGLLSGVFGAGLSYGLLRNDVADSKKRVEVLERWRERKAESDATLVEKVANIERTLDRLVEMLEVKR